MGTDNFSSVYFDALAVQYYDPQLGLSDVGANSDRIWDTCLIETTKKKREKFCKDIYGKFQEGVDKCIKLYNYCDQCCDTVIHPLETILNFACFRGCIREAKAANVRVMEKKIADAELLAALRGNWNP